MKRATAFLAAFCMAVTLLAACGAKNAAPDQASGVSKQDLVHHAFVLASINGNPFVEKERLPTLEFNEGFRVSGAVCNRFTGQAELENGMLTVKQMASTRMLCADQELNRLENDFSRMLMDGAAITLAGKILTLGRDGYVLEFVLRDLAR